MKLKSSSVWLLLFTTVFIVICISFTINRETEVQASTDP